MSRLRFGLRPPLTVFVFSVSVSCFCFGLRPLDCVARLAVSVSVSRLRFGLRLSDYP